MIKEEENHIFSISVVVQLLLGMKFINSYIYKYRKEYLYKENLLGINFTSSVQLRLLKQIKLVKMLVLVIKLLVITIV